ncbi:MAG: hypothetical protein JRH20_18670 [Deltaproteobacteria bacterium]|nr:hypothetical protein [Deltaproteobacteria bacterium]
MTWRNLCWTLFILSLVVGVLRLMTGNLLGAVITLALAAYLGSVVLDYPVLKRLKQLLRLLRWRKRD